MTWQHYLNQYSNQWLTTFHSFPAGFWGFFFVILPLLLLWSLVWKGIALWRAAQRGDRWWFIIFFVVNTLGVLEIIYLLYTRDKKREPSLSEEVQRMQEKMGLDV